MKKTLLKFRNPDSSLDLNTQLSEFFAKGLISGGLIEPVIPNSQPQVEVGPFKLIGSDGMVVLETADTETLTLSTNQTTVITFHSEYVVNGTPIAEWQTYDLSAWTSLSADDKSKRVVFGSVTTAGATDTPVVSYELRDVIDQISRSKLRGWVEQATQLPASDNRVGDTYIVESGQDSDNTNGNNGLYVFKGSLQGWVNLTNSYTVANDLMQHRMDLFTDEQHMTNDQSDAVAGTYGTPSATNKFVTETDPILPTLDEKEAMVGLSQDVPTPPSATNKFVTAAYNMAEPSAVSVSASGAFLILPQAAGPYFVGEGSGHLTAIQYFGLWDTLKNREYVNSFGEKVTITGVYKDAAPTELNPALEASVANSNGFWSQAVYLTFSGVVDTPVLVRFGRQLNLENISRGVALKTSPRDAHTSSEVLERLQQISGRLFDDPLLEGETNVELRDALVNNYIYTNSVTAGNLVIDQELLRGIRDRLDTTQFLAGYYGFVGVIFGMKPYSVGYTSAAISGFDPSYTEDYADVAVVTYTPAVSLAAVKPGYIFIDDIGRTYRILAVNTSTSQLLLFTRGTPINSTNTGGGNGVVVKHNNYRIRELTNDHRTSFLDDMIAIEGVVARENDFEALPPGGVHVGSFTPANNWSAISTATLPNQGNPNGTVRGRPNFGVTPLQRNGLTDPRVTLIGGWKNDPNYPRAAVGEVSQNSIAVNINARLSDVTLYTAVSSTAPYGFRVFVDGAYDHAASQFLTDRQVNGKNPSDAVMLLRDSEVVLQPIFFPISHPGTALANIQIEITQGTEPFRLYGVKIHNRALSEEAGFAFVSTQLVSSAAYGTSLASALPWSPRGAKYTRYIDLEDQIRKVAISYQRSYSVASVSIAAGANTYSHASLSSAVLVGDIQVITTRTGASMTDAANTYLYRYVTGIDRATGQVTLNASIPSAGNYRVELWGSIPTSASGVPVLAAVPAERARETARLKTKDWDVGLERDIANLHEVLNETKVTTLDDASTSLTVRDCVYVTEGIEGYLDGIRLNETTSEFIITAMASRIDVVFSGEGSPATIDVEIDGVQSYTLTVANDGVAQHTLFSDAAYQSHTVKISNPSVAGAVVISEVIIHHLNPAPYAGTPISEYNILKNAHSSAFVHDFFPTSGAQNACVVSNAGVRLVDLTKSHATYYDGSGGTTDWQSVEDFDDTPRFGYFMQTDRTDAFMKVQADGSHFELYYWAKPDGGIVQITIDGLPATSLNFPNKIYGSGVYDGVTGQLDTYAATATWKRLVITGLALTSTHHIYFTVTGTKNPGSTGYFFRPSQWAENPGAATLLKSPDGRLHTSSYEDKRPLLTLLPAQHGREVQVGEGSSAPVTTLSGYLYSAFAMSDGSGTPKNCTIGVSGGKTYLDLTFPWVQGLNPGTTVGDLDVIADGLVLPRRLAGVTQDAHYYEDAVLSNRIWFLADYSAVPISLEVRRKNGTKDESALNTARLTTYHGNKVVGTSVQVAAGLANYSSLQLAIDDSSPGEYIEVLNVSTTENITIPHRLNIHGRGYDSYINGTITFANTVTYATIKGIRFVQAILPLGADKNQIVDSFWTSSASDANANNRIDGVQL